MPTPPRRLPWSTLERAIFDEEQSAPRRPADAPKPTTRLVLVVDDDADMRLYLCDCLASRFETLEATDGAAALRQMHRRRPALVVSDVVMPGLDGYALCRAMHDDAALCGIPVLLVSGEETTTLAHRVREVGAAAFLLKPFNRQTLLDCVARLLPDDAPG